MKPKFLTIANHDTMVNLGSDYGECFLNTLEAKIMKIEQENPLQLRLSLLEGFIGSIENLLIVRLSVGT